MSHSGCQLRARLLPFISLPQTSFNPPLITEALSSTQDGLYYTMSALTELLRQNICTRELFLLTKEWWSRKSEEVIKSKAKVL